MMSEASQAYGCDRMHECAGSAITCDNDGYAVSVDGRCQCRCPWMLDPDTGCRTPAGRGSATQAWPAGSYALPATHAGCPGGGMKAGRRVHYSGGGNSVSAGFAEAMATTVEDARVEHQFCVAEDKQGSAVWHVHAPGE